jgi:hypothetical protein
LACSRTIEAMPLQIGGHPWHLISDQSCRLIRSLNKKSTIPGALSEQFVTIGAASLALLVVAAIAVLMGMA